MTVWKQVGEVLQPRKLAVTVQVSTLHLQVSTLQFQVSTLHSPGVDTSLPSVDTSAPGVDTSLKELSEVFCLSQALSRHFTLQVSTLVPQVSTLHFQVSTLACAIAETSSN